MPGADLTPVTAGAVALALLTYVLYRSVQRTRALRRAGRPVPRSSTALVVVYVIAWIGYALIIVGAVRGGL